MKHIILIIASVLMTFSAFSQKEKVFFDHLIQQEFDQTAKYFGNEVELCIGDFEEMVSKNEAITRIKNFFAENNPKQYAIRHSGDSKGGQSNYYVLDLSTSNGSYRLFTYFDKVGDLRKISELRIEK